MRGVGVATLASTRRRSRPRADLLIRRASQVVTLQGFSGRPVAGPVDEARLGIVEDGAVACAGDRIVAVGPTAQVERLVAWDARTVVLDARGQTVLPGFVDCHTHAVYAGDRADEWARRLRGADYLEILRSGGGILSTVRKTREAPAEELVQSALGRLGRMLRSGTTTAEVKSGYALTVEGEIRLLQVVQALAQLVPMQLVPTFMGAHAVPPEYAGSPDAYVDLMVGEMLPAVAARPDLARFCDVFCEQGAFTVPQARRILTRAAELGLGLKLHADQFHATGAAALAAELKAVSADHLNATPPEELALLARAGTVAVLLPAADLITRQAPRPPVELMRELGVPMAIATDHNPGTSPVESMPLVAGLACSVLGLTPEEAVAAATINGAHALALAQEVGSLEPGKRADLVVLDAPSYLHLPYRLGVDLVGAVVAGGRLVWGGEGPEVPGGGAGEEEAEERDSREHRERGGHRAAAGPGSGGGVAGPARRR